MVSTAPLIPLQAPKDVSLSKIQSELDAIWTMYSQPSSDGSILGASKATTFTLLVYEPEETQQLLAELGYYSGPVDGISGPRMNAAIHSAQVAYDMKVSDRVSIELIARLRKEVFICRGVDTQEGDVCNISPYSLDTGGAGLADAIAAQNPCRIISLLPSTDLSDDSVTAQVSAYCPIQKRTASSMICCEYITLKGIESALARSSSLVQSLLQPGLPSFLWWKGEPNLDQTLFQELAEACTVLIVDSSNFVDNPEGHLAKLDSMREMGIQIADLNWRRLAPWQELTAEAFDAPERLQSLLEVDRVTLHHEKGNRTQALLYLGWLASRLSWKVVSRVAEGGDLDIQRIFLTGANGRQIEADLLSIDDRASGLIVGDLLDLRLTSSNPEADCCMILCSETTGCMRMEAQGGAESCWVNQVTTLDDQQAESLLSEQLRTTMRDLLFEESLAIAAQIVRAN
jgi:glucose-6-phosphate dehydrogenase assembly protein OpcA